MAISTDAYLFMLTGNLSLLPIINLKNVFLCFMHNAGKDISATIPEMGPPSVT